MMCVSFDADAMSVPYCSYYCRYRTAVEDVPVGEYEIPLGQARIVRQGTDVTLVSWGQQVKIMEQAVRKDCHIVYIQCSTMVAGDRVGAGWRVM